MYLCSYITSDAAIVVVTSNTPISATTLVISIVSLAGETGQRDNDACQYDGLGLLLHCLILVGYSMFKSLNY